MSADRPARPEATFLDIEMPDSFVLECLTSNGLWIDWGLYASSMFDHSPDGTYVCSGWGGSPLFLRCLRQDGSVIYVLNGAGQPFTYRPVAFPGGAYSENP